MKKRKAKKTKREILEDCVLTVQLLIFIIGVPAVHILLAEYYELHPPETMVGTAGLLAVRRQLILYLLFRIVRVICPAVLIITAGILGAGILHEKIRITKIHLLCMAIACLTMYPLAFRCRTGLEVQCEINGYKGPRPVQTVSLLLDVQRDLEERAPEAPEEQYLRPAREDRGYLPRTRGGHAKYHNVWEYVLYPVYTSPDTPYAQIAKSDWEHTAELCRYTPHQVARYPHSGLLASFDGGAVPVLHDLESLFTLTRDGNSVRRTTVPQESSFRYFCFVTERNGQEIGRISAEHSTEEWFSTGLQTRVWLEMLYEGQTVRVSNILEF